MVDCGMPFSKMKEDLYLVDTLLITHRHTDHIKPRVYERIREEFPNIRVAANWDVASRYEVDVICNEGYPFELGGIEYLPFRGHHGVLCYGYAWELDGQSVIYATDMASLKMAPHDRLYDWMFLESNHDQHKLMAAMGNNRKYGYDAYGAGLMHCSTQECLGFYYTHRRSTDSTLVELHKSDRFY